MNYLVIVETPMYSGPPYKHYMGPYSVEDAKRLINRVTKEYGLAAWYAEMSSEQELIKLLVEEPWMIKKHD